MQLLGQMTLFTLDNGPQQLFGMAVGTGVQRLRQRAFDGTIVWKLMSMGLSCSLIW